MSHAKDGSKKPRALSPKVSFRPFVLSFFTPLSVSQHLMYFCKNVRVYACLCLAGLRSCCVLSHVPPRH